MKRSQRPSANKAPQPILPHDTPTPPPLCAVEGLLPDLPGYNPKPADRVHMSESPVPGLILQNILRGYESWIDHIAWSPDGHLLTSVSIDNTVRIWNVELGECTIAYESDKAVTYGRLACWSPDGRFLALQLTDRTIDIWDATDRTLVSISIDLCDEPFLQIAWSPDGHWIAYVTYNEPIRIWNPSSGELYWAFAGYGAPTRIAWSPNGELLASANEYTSIIELWDTKTRNRINTLNLTEAFVDLLSWSPDGQFLVSGSGYSIRIWDTKTWELHQVIEDTRPGSRIEWTSDGHIFALDSNKVIHLWDSVKGRKLAILEGHTESILDYSFGCNSDFLVSIANDSICLWNTDNWELAAIVETSFDKNSIHSATLHPNQLCFATLRKNDTIINIWHLELDTIIKRPTINSVRYTTAKLVLVGDSGVGKTGLGWRLAHDEFKEHASTHGQQFWVVDELGKIRDDGTECEAVLWDVAGQHVYRPIHSIFLDNVDASLVLFDPTNRQDTLKGAQFWLEQLKGKGQLPPSVLVGARMDRGGATVSQDYLAQFCQQYGIGGGYVPTSAKTGKGLEQLLDILKDQIPWDAMTTTVTTRTFKRIKEHVLALKEQPERTNVLVNPAELRAQLKADDTDWQFTDAEMMTAVGHLETRGFVTVLTSSSGETHILLAPELLANLASSIVLLADKHPRELGAVSETELLQGRYAFDELTGLDMAEQQVLLDAVVLRFQEHNVCFRETFDGGAEREGAGRPDTLLIFPGLIKQKRPLDDDFPATDDVSYVVRGRVENLYAMLVVLLGYTPSFIRINQWQRQAQYAMGEGQICGFRMIEDREGEIELVLYYSDQMPPEGREEFQALFERFLYQRDVTVTRYPPVVCPEGHRLERAIVVGRIREEKDFAFCAECGKKVDLPELDKPGIGTAASPWLEGEEAAARLRSTYEQYLGRVKGYRREWATPRCYLSRAPGHEDCATSLIKDLRDAGVYVIADAENVQDDDYVVILDIPAYQHAWKTTPETFASDRTLISSRMVQDSHHLISIVLEDDAGAAALHNLAHCILGNFCDATHYPVSLFNLVLELYAIPLNHAGFAPLREALHKQWEAIPKVKDGTGTIDSLGFDAKVMSSNTNQLEHANSSPSKGGSSMSGISRELIQKLRKTLGTCGPLNTDADLSQVFFDERISAWASRVPSASNRMFRINALINFLHTQYNTERQNVLALFLRVIGEMYEPTMACYQELVALAEQVERETDSAPTGESNTETQGAGSTKQTSNAVQSAEEYVDFEIYIDNQGNIRAKSEEGVRKDAIAVEVPDDIDLTLSLIENNAANENLLQKLGKRFYGMVFADEIDKHFNQVEAVARSQGKNVRIRLAIEPDALARLPWEFTFREEGGYYMSVNPKTAFSRYLDLPLPPNRVRRRNGPLDLLIIIANPSDQVALDPDKWEDIVVKALKDPISENLIATRTVKEATLDNIMDALLQRRPDIVQFVGHGVYRNDKGYLALVDDDGESWLVDDARFADLFMGADDHLGLVNLTACEGATTNSPQGFLGIAPKMVQRGIPAVVAMQYSVLISTGKTFLRNFYKAIAARKPVDWAVQHARNFIALKEGKGNREFATPVLYMRAKDGEVF